MTGDDLKDVGKMRKAFMPIFEMIHKQLNLENQKRFELIDKKIDKIAAVKPIVNLEKVDVPQPDVHVNVQIPETLTKAVADNQADLATLVEVVKALQGQTIKAEQITYLPHDQDNGSVVKYNGFLSLDGNWYIQRITKGEQRYVKGKDDYAKAWDNRSKLKYGLASEGSNEL